MQKALIVEDFPGLQAAYRRILANDFEVEVVESLAGLRKRLFNQKAGSPDVVVADLSLEDGNLLDLEPAEFEVLKNWPTIVVSVHDDLETLDKCMALWARDYLTKPFNNNELLHKCKRAAAQSEVILRMESMTVLYRGNESEPLTAIENRICSTLLANPSGIRKQELMRTVYGNDEITKKLDVALVRLRQKLRPLGLSVVMVAEGCVGLSKLSKDRDDASSVNQRRLDS